MLLLQQALHILYFITLPMLLLSGIGFLLQKTLGLDTATLTRLNLYLVVPANVYYSVCSSRISPTAILVTAAFSLTLMALLAGLTLATAALRRLPRDQWNALLATTLFYNSGNYGLPLQDLAFARFGLSAPAMAHQVVVMLVQNTTNFSLGVFLASSGKPHPGSRSQHRHLSTHLLHVLKFPSIHALVAALVTLQIRRLLPADTLPVVDQYAAPFWYAVTRLQEAFVPVALVTLGAQLAAVKPFLTRYPVKTSVVLRLLAGPALALALVHAFNLHGLTAQVLLISASTPTAINALLVCMEFDNHPDYLSRAVFYSTLFSPLTVTLTLLTAQSGLFPRFALTP